MFSEQLIARQARNSTVDGFTVRIRLNWYRALPISCIERLDLVVDGARIPPERMTLSVAGGDYPVARLAEHDDDWWFVLDEATLRVAGPGGLSPGEHHAELVLGTRIPYFGPDPSGDFAVVVDRSRVTLVVA